MLQPMSLLCIFAQPAASNFAEPIQGIVTCVYIRVGLQDASVYTVRLLENKEGTGFDEVKDLMALREVCDLVEMMPDVSMRYPGRLGYFTSMTSRCLAFSREYTPALGFISAEMGCGISALIEWVCAEDATMLDHCASSVL